MTSLVVVTPIVHRLAEHDVAWAEAHHHDGLVKAYATPSGLYRQGNVLYIAGTKSFGDVLDDLKIPFNDVEDTQRYRDAEPLLHGVDIVVGHSLGGSVALTLADRHHLTPVTYGAPVLDLNPFDSSGSNRHRHAGDPVALLDLAAQTSASTSWNPHSFD